ncbi:MAG: hypothetical protein IKO32_00715 [Lachnospiraceae bacterium]|nr:hypothetical protein [Lachnospiraceae bacterium]
MTSREVLETMGATKETQAVSVIGKREPVAHPKNCFTECAYGRGKSFCFPCMAKILSEHNAMKKEQVLINKGVKT